MSKKKPQTSESSHKNFLSWVGIAIGVASLFFNWVINQKNDKRWEDLNRPTIVMKNAEIVSAALLPKSKALSMDWGYSPTTAEEPTKTGDEGTIRVACSLVAIDPEKNSTIPLGIILTMREMNLALKKRRAEKSRVMRQCMAKFTFQNLGKLSAADVGIKISMGNSTTKIPASKSALEEAYPGQEFSQVVKFYLEVSKPIPQDLAFEVSLNYKDPTTQVKSNKTINLSYSFPQNYWTFDSPAKSEPERF